jgi:RNase P subunit RPR2
MRCKRCDGLMIVELSVEEELEEQLAERGALRCVNCGAMVNVRMLKNLATQHAERLTPTKQPGPRVRQSQSRLFMGRTL